MLKRIFKVVELKSHSMLINVSLYIKTGVNKIRSKFQSKFLFLSFTKNTDEIVIREAESWLQWWRSNMNFPVKISFLYSPNQVFGPKFSLSERMENDNNELIKGLIPVKI